MDFAGTEDQRKKIKESKNINKYSKFATNYEGCGTWGTLIQIVIDGMERFIKLSNDQQRLAERARKSYGTWGTLIQIVIDGMERFIKVLNGQQRLGERSRKSYGTWGTLIQIVIDTVGMIRKVQVHTNSNWHSSNGPEKFRMVSKDSERRRGKLWNVRNDDTNYNWRNGTVHKCFEWSAKACREGGKSCGTWGTLIQIVNDAVGMIHKCFEWSAKARREGGESCSKWGTLIQIVIDGIGTIHKSWNGQQRLKERAGKVVEREERWYKL